MLLWCERCYVKAMHIPSWIWQTNIVQIITFDKGNEHKVPTAMKVDEKRTASTLRFGGEK